MAVFDFFDEELSFSRENKSMYLFFMDKSIDISVPHSLPMSCGVAPSGGEPQLHSLGEGLLPAPL